MKKRNNKTKQEATLFSVSEEAIEFIRTYILPIKHIDFIDEDVFHDIFDIAESWELDMIDENGFDKKDDPFIKRNTMGMNFVSEISGQNGEPNFEDLNRRLGLRKTD